MRDDWVASHLRHMSTAPPQRVYTPVVHTVDTLSQNDSIHALCQLSTREQTLKAVLQRVPFMVTMDKAVRDVIRCVAPLCKVLATRLEQQVRHITD